jgi:cholesterol oxidase
VARTQRADTGPVKEERHGVVIIGSGVGGSVAAFRLAEAGVDNVVLERGRRWPANSGEAGGPLLWGRTFRSSLRPETGVAVTLTRLAIAGAVAAARRQTGPLELWVHRRLIVGCGAAVGGTTVVYGGVLAQPHRDVFSRLFPPELDYTELDDTYYPRALHRMIGESFPDSLLNHPRYGDARTWYETLTAAGLPKEPIVGNFDFDTIRAELAGQAVPAVTVGKFSLSCASGAKMSMDRTYLARAEATGRTVVRPLHLVTAMSEDRHGRYRVTVERLDPDGTVIERSVLVCDRLILAAGAVHTPRLLVTARDTGQLPRLNEHVGRHWGTNGDQACLLVTTAFRPGRRQPGPPSYFARDHDNTLSVLHGVLPVSSGLVLILGMGLPDGYGQWTYRPKSGTTHLEWDPGNDTSARRLFTETVRKITARIPTIKRIGPGGTHTLHPLGGAVLGKATDAYGRLHGYRGLYCQDGALMPGSAGAVNPALTIAAVVERCMDHLISDFTNLVDTRSK